MGYKKLLVATDLTEASDNAIRCAVNLAKKFDAEIILLHVFEVAEVDESARRIIGSSFLNREIKRQLQEICDDTIRDHGIKTSYLTKEGELFRMIADSAKETGSDCLFVGTHGVLGVQHITGSFIAKTINACDVPVWVNQKDSKSGPYEHIFILMDEMFDQPSHNWITSLAKGFGAELHFVFTEPSHAYSVSEMIQRIKNQLEPEGFACHIRSVADEADKHKAFLKEAEGHNGVLLIINRNGVDADEFVDILTNHQHLEVLCLDR